MKLFFYLINACNYAINYCNSPRETPSQKMTSPAGLSQRLRTHLPKTTHHTHAPPNSLPPKNKQQKTNKKPYPKQERPQASHYMDPQQTISTQTAVTQPPQLTTKETPGDM